MMMNFEQKYLKYKIKYLNLKKQLGGSFHFSVYVFSKYTLDTTRISYMVELLKSLYGGEIDIIRSKEESYLEGFYWKEAVRYISNKSVNVPYYTQLINVTSFVINNSSFLEGKIDDETLTIEEHRINNELYKFNLVTLSVPDIKSGINPEFSRGWGFFSPGIAIITLVEKYV